MVTPARARAVVPELKGHANIIPNQVILLNVFGLREAQDCSEIENIITTQNEVYPPKTLTAQCKVTPVNSDIVLRTFRVGFLLVISG
ncbi:MAG: hypothetical protein EA383_06035 [Spirochaetaceae bacterium]|nr:MAG: hypothetical protein EA383_06035 [Spirochaetaceae bacterium]